MARDDLISAYLAEVGWGLGRERRAGTRILPEIEDHLREAAERHQAAGAPTREAQQRAITAFGDPGHLALAFRDALNEGVQMGPFIRYSGALGVLAPVVAFAGFLSWSLWTYVASMLLLGISVLGMVAAQPREARWIAAGALTLVPVGLALAPVAEPVAKVAVFAGFLGCALAFLAGRVLPRAAVLLMVGGAALFASGVFTGVAELPGWLQGIAFGLISAGWMWSSWTLWRSTQGSAAIPSEPATA